MFSWVDELRDGKLLNRTLLRDLSNYLIGIRSTRRIVFRGWFPKLQKIERCVFRLCRRENGCVVSVRTYEVGTMGEVEMLFGQIESAGRAVTMPNVIPCPPLPTVFRLEESDYGRCDGDSCVQSEAMSTDSGQEKPEFVEVRKEDGAYDSFMDAVANLAPALRARYEEYRQRASGALESTGVPNCGAESSMLKLEEESDKLDSLLFDPGELSSDNSTRGISSELAVRIGSEDLALSVKNDQEGNFKIKNRSKSAISDNTPSNYEASLKMKRQSASAESIKHSDSVEMPKPDEGRMASVVSSDSGTQCKQDDVRTTSVVTTDSAVHFNRGGFGGRYQDEPRTTSVVSADSNLQFKHSSSFEMNKQDDDRTTSFVSAGSAPPFRNFNSRELVIDTQDQERTISVVSANSRGSVGLNKQDGERSISVVSGEQDPPFGTNRQDEGRSTSVVSAESEDMFHMYQLANAYTSMVPAATNMVFVSSVQIDTLISTTHTTLNRVTDLRSASSGAMGAGLSIDPSPSQTKGNMLSFPPMPNERETLSPQAFTKTAPQIESALADLSRKVANELSLAHSSSDRLERIDARAKYIARELELLKRKLERRRGNKSSGIRKKRRAKGGGEVRRGSGWL
ncbi:hypothetical protein BJ742DRAFT_884372 [Cladochytrium replicatum]|nr:hypothetical protein BJ742DRAFT_884372 [Cladochytrium replicatum]